MSELYCDTRLKNRAFHNFSNVSLSPDQIKTLSLNSKFVPRPKVAAVKPTLDAVDDFVRRLQLRVHKNINDGSLRKFFGETTDRGQPRYVPRFHIPNPYAQGPLLIDQIEVALAKTRAQIEVEVLNRQTLLIRPNINQKDLKALLKLLADKSPSCNI
ncbi:hypothetical protein DFH07DRAFT_785746 [Mycena maculata]|uniref:Uncharacterized protein n=1 Tax=Mycena maculata TaxID=230809 RepID=A0AAD7MF76_9AGAR|nr:hypothetical protein DFH07DRAFT_785746 [Mycena maculata]